MKYPCGQCEYQATTKGSLSEHRRAVHEGIKYPCGQCQHQATTKGNPAKQRRGGFLLVDCRHPTDDTVVDRLKCTMCRINSELIFLDCSLATV